jgi:hypothetical protein
MVKTICFAKLVCQPLSGSIVYYQVGPASSKNQNPLSSLKGKNHQKHAAVWTLRKQIANLLWIFSFKIMSFLVWKSSNCLIIKRAYEYPQKICLAN